MGLRALASGVNRLEAQIPAWHRTDDTSRRLATISDLDPSLARRLPQQCRMARCSDPDGSSRLGLVARRVRKAPAGRNNSAALASRATVVCADYSSWAPRR